MAGNGVRVIILTGDGPIFSAGANLNAEANSDEFYTTHLHTLGVMQRSSALIIGYLNGPAIGAGCQLAMACDLRIADESAAISIPAIKVGMAMDPTTVASASSLLGGALARRLLLGAETLNYEQIIHCGFAQPGDLASTQQLAEDLATKAPLSLAQLKTEFATTGWLPPAKEERQEAADQVFASSDIKEARAAWLEKRQPRFTGA